MAPRRVRVNMGAMSPTGALVGRGDALDDTARFVEGLADGPSAMLVEGEAGIGKTTVWRAAATAAAARGSRVICSTAAEGETDLPFVGLRDLMEQLPADATQHLPAPQRDALDVALLRSDRPDATADQHAVCVAALGVVRTLATDGPLVVAVDDVGWLDHASARVLRYVIRRLSDEPVGILATRRPVVDPGPPLGMDGPAIGARLRRVVLGPLDPESLHTLLTRQHGFALPQRVTRRIHAACGGNPFAAVEIGRAVAAGLGPVPASDALPLPDGVLDVTARRIAALSEPGRRTLAVASTATAPTVALITAALGEQARDGLHEAVAHGLLELDAGAVRFPHPLLRSAAAATLSGRERRALHRRLADLVGDPDERAVHLAEGALGPDAAVAAAVHAAAGRAFARGAPDTAAVLASRSAALTPADDGPAAARREIDAGVYHYRAENPEAARTTLDGLVARLPAGPLRADAFLWLACVRQAQNGMAEAVDLAGRALAEAVDPAMRAAAQRHLALASVIVGRIVEGDEHAAAALRTAQTTGDRSSVAESQAALAWTQFWLGRGLRADLLEGALGCTTWNSWYAPNEASPGVVGGLLLGWADQFAEARGMLEAEHARLTELGHDRPRAVVRFTLAELECRAGRWDVALEHATEGLHVADLAGDEFYRSLLSYARGLVAAHRGDLDAARADAHLAVAVGASTGSAITMWFASTVLGFAALSEGDHAGADAHLGPLAAALPRDGRFDPGLTRFVPNEVEALVALGRTADAEELLALFAGQAAALDRPWALAAAARCRALLLSAAGDHVGAQAAVDAALVEHGRVEMPFESARTLLVAGTVARRARRRRDARTTLEAARAAFVELGAVVWERRADAELGRIGGRAPASGELTDAERRIVELVVAGGSNKDVAAQLYLAPATVEAALSRIYRKLGVGSRTQLAAHVRAGRAH